MKNTDFDDSLELDDGEYARAIFPCPRIEDANDLGEIGDSFSIGLNAFDGEDY
jgi:hypothetical protein